MSPSGALLRAVLAAVGAFLVVGLLLAGILGALLQPDIRGLTSDQDIDSYTRLGAYTKVVAGFVAAIAAGAAGALLADRFGLTDRARRTAIFAAPLVLGILWLLAIETTGRIFVAGLLLYVLGAALGATLVAFRSEPPQKEGSATDERPRRDGQH
jgi:hypothetical protein